MSEPVETALLTALPTAVSSIDVQLLVTLFDQASDVAFFVKNAQGQYMAVNDSLLNRHGLKKNRKPLASGPTKSAPVNSVACPPTKMPESCGRVNPS